MLWSSLIIVWCYDAIAIYEVIKLSVRFVGTHPSCNLISLQYCHTFSAPDRTGFFVESLSPLWHGPRGGRSRTSNHTVKYLPPIQVLGYCEKDKLRWNWPPLLFFDRPTELIHSLVFTDSKDMQSFVCPTAIRAYFKVIKKDSCRNCGKWIGIRSNTNTPFIAGRRYKRRKLRF